jgi:hypothetical protein
MGLITSADAVLTLAIDTIFPLPVQLKGFAADDVYDVPAIRNAEVQMGVDGLLSAGFVFVAITQSITLQADSLSGALFDAWYNQEQAAKTKYAAQGNLRLPSIASRFVQTKGFLTSYKPLPAGRRVLQPRTFEITWERVAPSPLT